MHIVNFGCGSAAAKECINIDGSLTVLLAKLPIPAKFFGRRARFVASIRDRNIRFGTARGLKLKDASIDAFYSSHTLEHLTPADCENLLVRVHRWLKPGGVLRVVLPDLNQIASAYVGGKIDADTFVSQTQLSTAGSRFLSLLLGHAEHRWMYDYESFANVLNRLGYRETQKSDFGNSMIPELASLDLETRRLESFYVEAVR